MTLRPHDIGRRIKTRRRERSITQRSLADRVGVTFVHLSHIENGRAAPSLSLLCRIADELQASLDELAPRNS
jgi:transcriptional regulator with XRE-family HTH domain